MTPLGSPVVPEVNPMCASDEGSTSVGVPEDSAFASSSKVSQPGSLGAPTPITTTFSSSGADSRSSRAISAKSRPR
jgi:hypothetical protein